MKTAKQLFCLINDDSFGISVQAARMQQAKNDAAKNWRASLSGGGAEMKNNIEKMQDKPEEQTNNKQAGEQPPVTNVQERANKDRSVTNHAGVCAKSEF